MPAEVLRGSAGRSAGAAWITKVSIGARPGDTIARSVCRGVHPSSRRPPANRGAAKRQGGTRNGQPTAAASGILDEKLVCKGRTR